MCAVVRLLRCVMIGPYLHLVSANHAEIRLERPATLELHRAGEGAIKRFSPTPSDASVIEITGLEPRTRYAYSVGGVSGEFVTAPPDDSLEPFTALVYGDNRTDDEAHAAVASAMERTPSDFLLHTGDFVGDSRRQKDWDRFFDVERTLLRDRCVFGAIGNHDVLDDGRAYEHYFGAQNQTMRWAFVRFFFVSSNDDSPQKWLDSELSAHDGENVRWRVVVLHHGPYASGPHGPNPDIKESTLASWRTHQVDLILSGHDHIYERGVANGLRYVVSGGGGAPPYPIEQEIPTTRKA